MNGHLSTDQRWLLRSVGGWAMRDCLLGPEGVTHLMQSSYGSSGHVIDGGPDWLAGGFQCGGGKVVSPGFGDPVVTVTAAQINRYAKTLPAALVTEMAECRLAARAEGRRADRDEYWRIQAWQDDLLDRALGFECVDEPVGQLELFEVAS